MLRRLPCRRAAPSQARQRAKRVLRLLRALNDNQDVRLAMQYLQFCASLLFVVLYIWGTYSTPAPSTFRYKLDVGLCVYFGLEYLHRLVVRGAYWAADQRTRRHYLRC